MPLRPEVVERLLIAKTLLDGIRFQPSAEPTRATLTTQILTAHDAAELAIAALAHQLGVSPPKEQNYLMSYFDPVKQKMHPEKDVFAKDYFSSLNRVRVDIKHYGLFPEAKQWERVGELTYSAVSKWCSDYLGMTLAQLDESALLIHDAVQEHFAAARQSVERGTYKESFEELGKALCVTFKESASLRGLQVGDPKPEDAIRLSGYGIHANDFLTMQEFLPRVSMNENGEFDVKWRQSMYGHPGNWRENAAIFCLRTVLQVVLRIQNAEWIPGAIHFAGLYETQITSIRDGVELWKMTNIGENQFEMLAGTKLRKDIVKTLSKGESMRGYVHLTKDRTGFYGIGSDAPSRPADDDPLLSFSTHDQFGLFVRLADVKVTCVPRESDLVKQYFPNLPDIEWQPE